MELGFVGNLDDEFLEDISSLPVADIKKEILARSKNLSDMEFRDLAAWEELIHIETDIFRDVPAQKCRSC